MSNAARADDVREAGWLLAVHNDYVLDGVRHIFSVFAATGGRCAKGVSDADALGHARGAVAALAGDAL